MQRPSSKDINANLPDISIEHSIRGRDQQTEQDTASSPLPVTPDDNDRTVPPPRPAPVCLQKKHIHEIRRSSRVPVKRKLYDAGTGKYI